MTTLRPAASPGPGPVLAYGLFAATILVWGTNWPIMKIGLESIPPFWFALARVLLGSLVLFGVLLVVGGLRLPRRGDLPVVLSVGLLQVAAFLVAVNIAIPTVGAGRSALLAYTTPLFVVPGALLLLGERLRPLKLAGLLLGLLGLAILFNPAALDWDDPALLGGNALLMLAAFTSALAILHQRARRWEGTPLQLAPWQLLLAAPPLLAGALLFEADWRPQPSGELALILLHNGVVATGFCYWAVFTVTRALPTVSTSLGYLGVPMAGVASSALVLGEPLSASVVGGLLAILACLALVNLSDLRPRRPRH